MKVKFLICLIYLAFCSCNKILSSYYGVNKKMDFKNRDEYFTYIEKRKRIDKSIILYPDSSSYDSFLNKVYTDKLGYYYGTFINDTIAIRRSEFLKENVTCMGRVLSNLEEGLKSLHGNPDTLYELSKFEAFDFFEASTGEQYNIKATSKPLKIFLLYYFSSGRLFDRSYKEILEFADKNKDKVEIKVIVTDRISLYK